MQRSKGDAFCRICLGNAEQQPTAQGLVLPGLELIAPCSCSGTMKWVHRKCLNTWRYHCFMNRRAAPLRSAADTAAGWWDLGAFQENTSNVRTAAPLGPHSGTSLALDLAHALLGLEGTERIDIDTILRLEHLNAGARNSPFLACTVCKASYRYIDRAQHESTTLSGPEQSSGVSTSWLAKTATRLIASPRRRFFCSLTAVYLLVACLGHFLSLLGGQSMAAASQAQVHAQQPTYSSFACFDMPSLPWQSMSWPYRCLLALSIVVARLPAQVGCLLAVGARSIAPAPISLALACRLVSLVELTFGPVSHSGRAAHYTLLVFFVAAWSIRSWADRHLASHGLLPSDLLRMSAIDPILFMLTAHALTALTLDASLSLKVLHQRHAPHRSRQHAQLAPQEQPLYYWNVQSIA